MKCPKCGSKNVARERRPNGNDRCADCGHVWPSSESKDEDPPDYKAKGYHSRSEMRRIEMHKKDDIEAIATHLAEFFKDDPKKITYWLLTPNLNFGGVAPCTLVFAGRSHKLRQFVENAIEGNLP